jgi:hypothetical protein
MVRSMGDSPLPPFPKDRVWGEDAIRHIRRVTGHHREAAERSLRDEVDAGNRRMSGESEPARWRGQRPPSRRCLRPTWPIPSRLQFEHYYVDREDLEKRWPDDQVLVAEAPVPSPAVATNSTATTEAAESDDELDPRNRAVNDVIDRHGEPPGRICLGTAFG